MGVDFFSQITTATLIMSLKNTTPYDTPGLRFFKVTVDF